MEKSFNRFEQVLISETSFGLD